MPATYRRKSERIRAQDISQRATSKRNPALQMLVYLQDHKENQAAVQREVIRAFEPNWGHRLPRDGPFFDKFSELPIELQYEILDYALPGPRVLEFFPSKTQAIQNDKANGAAYIPPYVNFEYENNKKRCCSLVYCPSLLHVNRNTRAFTLRYYQPAFVDYLENKRAVYINFRRDIVLMPFVLDFDILFRGWIGHPPGREYWQQIEQLALPSRHQSGSYLNPRLFQSLRRVNFIDKDPKHCTEYEKREFTGGWVKKTWAKNVKKDKARDTKNKELEVVYLSHADFKKAFNCEGVRRLACKPPRWL